MDSGLLVGQIARLAGVSAQAVRYYERRGLLTKPERTPSGYRRYPNRVLQELQVIKAAQEVGFSLRDIKRILELVRDGPARCPPVLDAARARVVRLDEAIRSLTRVRKRLVALIEACGPEACELTLDRLASGDLSDTRRFRLSRDRGA